MPRSVLLGLLVLGSIVVAIELFARTGALNPVLFPPPTRVWATLGDATFLSNLTGQLLQTLLRAAVGFVLAATVAIPLGLILGVSTTLRGALTPLIELLRPIPSSAMVPVAILFLGLGAPMIIFVIWFGTLWPLLVSTAYGARTVDVRHKEIAHLLRLPRHQYFGLVVLPSAIPHIFSGTRVAIAIALILAVTAEMLAGQNGIGFLLLDYERAFRYPEMYACVVALALLGLAVNVVFVALQSSLTRRFPTLG
jgi:sulfonate transport system permease protein